MQKRGVKLGTPGNSLALQYELELQELEGGGAPTLHRVNKCFEILDEVIPHLGVFQRIIQLAKKELYVAIYSSDWTSKPKKHACKLGTMNLTPQPYFMIAQKLIEKKGGEHSKLKAEISTLKEQLYTCEADLEKAVSSLDTCRHDLKDREVRIHMLTSELRTLTAEKEHLQETISHHQVSKEHLCQEFDFRMFSLRNTLSTLKEEKEELAEYKAIHDQLQESQLLKTSLKNTFLLPATYENELRQHTTTAEMLKLQLLTLQNTLMDELDSWLQSCYSDKGQIVPAEVAHRKKVFKQKILLLSTEMHLLEKHHHSISDRQQQIAGITNISPHSALVLPLHPLNPLIPQEQTTSKYAAMMYTSNDGGNSYYALKVAQHCPSCNQKTVLCPHKICEDLVIQLPVNATHLKISRASFQLLQPKSHTIKRVNNSIANSPIDQSLHSTVANFGYLMEKFSKKYHNFQLSVQRTITEGLLLELVEQFYAALLLQDEQVEIDENEESILSLHESLFEFICQHYIVKTLAPISCHAFISSLEQFHFKHKELLILSHALCGDLDGCALRYGLVQASLVQTINNWSTHSQFNAFLTSIYPFLREEEVEQMGLNFIAFGDNCLSTHHVLDYMQLLLLGHKDPLVLMLEGQLIEQPCHFTGCMLEAEFAEAMEKIIPSFNGTLDLLSHQLFLQSLVTYQEKTDSNQQTLPIRNLAYIAAYLHRSSSLELMKNILKEISQRETKESTANQQKYKKDTDNEKRKFWHSMDTVKKLAHRIRHLH